MTLRDWFAGKALIGILGSTSPRNIYVSYTAKMAYAVADAMIAHRGEGNKR
jgi:hypothetical protein